MKKEESILSFQLVYGAAGAGKSEYMYRKIIEESIVNSDTNYILLVPEQYTMALQRKMILLHPNGGSMNIDVIGFNRLAYRIFDELNIKPGKILEDFGKTMLIRQVMGELHDKLSIYGKSLDKPGFIDEVKSLMSEMYQYDLSGRKIKDILPKLGEEDLLLKSKLEDMLLIFSAFEERLGEEYIVAEKVTELMYSHICESGLIKNSVICMDGFTGFTPIQLKCVEQLIKYSPKVYTILTIDRNYYEKERVGQHELFYLTRQTIDILKSAAKRTGTAVEEDIFIYGREANRWKNNEWSNEELSHLEKNIFRYPYSVYEKKVENIKVSAYDNPREEIKKIAAEIKKLVMKSGYRYRDVGVITGNIEQTSVYVEQIMPLFDIPYFLDYNKPVKNNRYIDGLLHFLRSVADNFSYDSFFSFLKAGIIPGLDEDDIEILENYCLKNGIRGIKYWRKQWDEEVEYIREGVMEYVDPACERLMSPNISVSEYVEAIKDFMDRLSYRERMTQERFYEKILSILDKMQEIMGSKNVKIKEFIQLFDIGLKDVTLGMIPGRLDMITIGDITRTRLEDIKVLFIIGVNDGVIPATGSSAGIISDREKERLMEFSFELAPTDKINSFVQQFYLYVNMTKPSERLYISFSTMNCDNEAMRPSYIIGRLMNIFTGLSVISCHYATGYDGDFFVATPNGGIEELTDGLRQMMQGDFSSKQRTLDLYKAYIENGYDDILERIENGLLYTNVPEKLSQDVWSYLRLNLMSQSVSRLETYSWCAYSYFLKYTLNLKERDIKGIDKREVGNILHRAMERIYRYVYDNMSNDWSAVGDNMRDELVDRFVSWAFEQEYDIAEDGRLGYLKDTLVRIGKRTARMLFNINMEGQYKPEFFEYYFKKEYELENTGEKISLSGIVDRGDLYYSKEKNQMCIRIIDYKSGKTEFSINKLYEGLQLQLAVYMNVMTELTGWHCKKKYKDDSVAVMPGGMYYYQMRDPYIDVEREDKSEEKRLKELKLRGMDADDIEVFNNITDYGIKKVLDVAEKILGGNIQKQPMRYGQKLACDTCDFKSVCRFDSKNGGNTYKYPQFKEKDKDKIIEKIIEMTGGDNNAMDRAAEKNN